MSVRRTQQVSGPPSKALAAVCTAGENLDYEVRTVDPQRGVTVMTSSITLQGLSLGYIATAFVEPSKTGTTIHVDVTPRFGFWALEGCADQVGDILDETRTVLLAPKARIRRPDVVDAADRPFGYRPQVFGLAWALLSVLVYTVGLGGGFVLPGIAGGLGGLFLLYPLRNRGWSWTVVVLIGLSLPFGLLGMSARREARTQAIWRAIQDEG